MVGVIPAHEQRCRAVGNRIETLTAVGLCAEIGDFPRSRPSSSPATWGACRPRAPPPNAAARAR
jgi:hypothetical protein